MSLGGIDAAGVYDNHVCQCDGARTCEKWGGQTYEGLNAECLVVEQRADDVQEDLEQLAVVLPLRAAPERRHYALADPLREVGQKWRQACVVSQTGERGSAFCRVGCLGL